MNNISIRSTLVLSILGILAIALLIIVENTKEFQEEDYYQEHTWPFSLSLIFSGAIVWYLGKKVFRTTERKLIDQETVQEVISRIRMISSLLEWSTGA